MTRASFGFILRTAIAERSGLLVCDGSTCKAEDLKTGSRIRMTIAKEDRNLATRIESLREHAEFATYG